MKNTSLTALIVWLLGTSLLAFPPAEDVPRGAAVVFEPPLISSADNEFYGLVLSPDGREAYWDRGQIWFARLQDGRWTEAHPIPFTEEGWRDTKPVLSADGTTMVFSSNRPVPGLKPAGATFLNLWIVRRTAEGWGIPQPLPASINTEWDEDFPVLAADNTLYFVSNRQGEPFRYRQYQAAWSPEGYLAAKECRLPFLGENEALSYLAPDSALALFSAVRQDGFGSIDIYISFRDAAGNWGAPINAGTAVNSSGVDWCARLSPNGSHLFFSSDRGKRRDIYWLPAASLLRLGSRVGR